MDNQHAFIEMVAGVTRAVNRNIAQYNTSGLQAELKYKDSIEQVIESWRHYLLGRKGYHQAIRVGSAKEGGKKICCSWTVMDGDTDLGVTLYVEFKYVTEGFFTLEHLNVTHSTPGEDSIKQLFGNARASLTMVKKPDGTWSFGHVPSLLVGTAYERVEAALEHMIESNVFGERSNQYLRNARVLIGLYP